MNKQLLYLTCVFTSVLGIFLYSGYLDFKNNGSADGTGFFEFIDGSVFIFLFLGIVVFIAFMLFDVFVWVLGRLFNRDFKFWLKWILATVGFWLIQNMILPPTSSLGHAIHPAWEFLRAAIIIVPVFLIYNYVIPRYYNEKETGLITMKFIVIFGGLFFSLLLAHQIIAMVPADDNISISHRLMFALGISFAVAFGNLLNNLRRHFFNLNKADKQLAQTNQDLATATSELEGLKSSVNPHFLYNALNSIATLAKTDPAKTEKMTIALASFYKYTTNREEKTFSTLAEELQMIDAYLEVEKVRFEDRLAFTTDIDSATNQILIPRFLLQPLIENAIKHGFDSKTQKMTCSLVAKKIDGRLHLYIHDSGVVFDENLAMGFGLKSVMRKLQLHYPENHTIEFCNDPKYIEIMISTLNYA